MFNIHHYCPVTSLVFQKISNFSEKKEKIYVINQEARFLERQGKNLSTFINKTITAIAYLIAIIATPLLLAIDGSCYIFRKKMNVQIINPYFADFHYHFTSKAFDAYFEQLQNFVKTQIEAKGTDLGCSSYQKNSFEEKGLSLIHFILKRHRLNSEESKRNFHQKVLEQLRDLVTQKQALSASHQAFDQEIAQFIDDLCEWIYTGPKLMPEMIDFVESQLTQEEIEQLETTDISKVPELIDQFHHRLETLPKFNGINDSPRLYDPHYLGDVPSVMYNYNQYTNDEMSSKKMKMIRTPSVTKDTERDGDGNLTQVQIVEEFTGFLDNYQKNKKVHVYFNLMQRNGSEGIRTKAIEELEQQYPNTIHVITLTKDFDFYWQRNSFSNLNNAEDFKKEFIAEMFDREGHSHYHWSPILGDKWKDECQLLLETVHNQYFNTNPDLSHQERLDFIELAYIEIIEVILNKLQPDSANDSCKSCIDRGAAALGEQYIKYKQTQQKDMSVSKRKKLMTIVLAPAILAMNRVMQLPRMPRFHSSAERLFSSQA